MHHRCYRISLRPVPRLGKPIVLIIVAAHLAFLSGCCGGDSGYTDAHMKDVAMGLGYTLLVRDDGRLLGFGANDQGGLGLGSSVVYSNTPTTIYASGIEDVAAGHRHSLILQTDGTLLACGDNDYGQLGDDSTTQRFTPVPVSGMTANVAAIAAGIEHSLILKTDGTLWACGNNSRGQLGVGVAVSSSDIPIQVTGITGTISAIEAGAWQSYAVTTDGKLFGWGYNYRGMIGNGGTATVWTPIEVISSGVAAASAGQAYTLVLKTDGSLWGCGENNFGQLAYSPCEDSDYKTSFYQLPVDSVASMSAGGWTGMALQADGTIMTWGQGAQGELGDGTYVTEQPDPVTVTDLTAAGGRLFAGWYHMIVEKEDGSLWVWGLQEWGQLGDGVGDGTGGEKRNTPENLVLP